MWEDNAHKVCIIFSTSVILLGLLFKEFEKTCFININLQWWAQQHLSQVKNVFFPKYRAPPTTKLVLDIEWLSFNDWPILRQMEITCRDSFLFRSNHNRELFDGLEVVSKMSHWDFSDFQWTLALRRQTAMCRMNVSVCSSGFLVHIPKSVSNKTSSSVLLFDVQS